MNKLYLDYTDMERMVQTIIRDINLDGYKPDYIVGITRGGLLPAVLISQYMNVPMYSLDVSLRDNANKEGPESNCWMAEDAFNGKNILIVDDINDSGATLNWIKEDWQISIHDEFQNVFGNNVRFATVVDNQSSDFNEVGYTGLEINKAENDVWVVFPFEDWWMSKPK